ncbi:unnamed protein product [Cuscuta europaea]|uniref:Integrase catalytic domain-containing protein n=1 Tax=Cuscuta europaea TaxID=41803 RepID=A0A9P0Z788_CUSEU|nr:unnamed protein product [Cuscuta europaea]
MSPFSSYFFVVECTSREVAQRQQESNEQWWTLATDESAGAKGCRGGIVLISLEGFRAYYAYLYLFKVSNNEVEYEVLLSGLRLAATMGAEWITVKCDSRLVVSQVKGEFEAKEERMMKYRDAVRELLGFFKQAELICIPRNQNSDAGLLSKLSQGPPKHISKIARIEEMTTSSIAPSSSIEVLPLQPVAWCWVDDLLRYIANGTLPDKEEEARLVRRRASGYVVLDGKLYKRSYNGTLLKCLRPHEADRIVSELHGGVCSAHQGACTIARKVILQGYFWSTIMKDCADYARKCETCQKFQKNPGRPATMYTPISTALPFTRWGVDLVGPLPTGSGNRKFVIVAVNYFTKWVEAEPLASITHLQCKKFIWKNIFCRFGVPLQIISDNGRQFDCEAFRQFCAEWGVESSRVAVCYPQANGHVENTNRTIVDGRQKKLEALRTVWVEELNNILWTFRTNPRKATGETPFALCYGFEARAPFEAVVLSRRVEEFEPASNEERLRAELHLIEERRDRVFIKAENYRQQIKAYQDSRARPRSFDVGDYVLRRRKASKPTEGGKLSIKWEGPYVVDAMIGPGTYKLKTTTGRLVDRVWNAEHLMKFY